MKRRRRLLLRAIRRLDTAEQRKARRSMRRYLLAYEFLRVTFNGIELDAKSISWERKP